MAAAVLADALGTIAVLAASLAAVFVAPGGMLLLAARVRLDRTEAPAYWFAASLALLTVSFAVCLALATSIAAAPVVLAVVTAAAAVAVRLASGRGVSRDPAPDPPRTHESSSWFTIVAIVLLVLACTAAAVAFAPVGSVDRWWYLAYVRGWLDAPALDLAEPFLGTGQAFARFGVHPWLFGLATCSWLSGLDPVVVYERGAPVVVVLASVSAAFALARELLGRGAHARLAVLATMLLWSGALVPVLARAGEDKILAASALLPLVLAAFLRMLRGASRGLLLLGLAAAATAAVHSLDYAFALLVLVPASAWLVLARPTARHRLMVAVVLLGVIALGPAASGLVVRERLSGIGADLATPDHPVVRVHEARERLVDLGFGGYVVQPQLLLHPLTPLALFGAFLLVRRRAGTTSFPTGDARTLVAVATFVPLAIAFVPPLPAMAGALIPPWMVYRVLWALPLAPLTAVAACSILRRVPNPEPWTAALILALGLPLLAAGTSARLSDARGRLATPSSAEFRGLVDALRALPADALVAAPPALAERIPALSARHVLAALDRSTIVFAGSRPAGETRLRARAAILAGNVDAAALTREAGVEATHAVYDPAAPVRPPCSRELFRDGSYVLCALSAREGSASPVNTLKLLPTPTRGAANVVARGRCLPGHGPGRIDAWSAAPPLAICTIDVPAAGDALALRVSTRTGRATDELLVTAAAGGHEWHGSARVRGNSVTAFVLPRIDTVAVKVRIASAFLPSLRVEGVELVELPEPDAAVTARPPLP